MTDDRPMTPIRITLILVLVMVAALLAAGCAGQTSDGKNMGNVPSTVLVTSIPSLKQIESPIVHEEGYYWIKMDPISDKYTGENFTITSTTNLSAGDEILVQVYPSTFFPGPKMQSREFYGATGTVLVIQGRSGINTILFDVNSSTLYNSTPLKPDEYVASEDAIRLDASSGVLFNVLPSSKKTMLKPKNFIDWEKLDLPLLKVNNSIRPEIPKFTMNFNTDSQYQDLFYYGSIVVFSTDGIVRFFDKNGTQIAAYFDYSTLHSYALSSGVMTSRPVGNVTTFTYNGEQLLTLIFEAGD